MVRREMLRSSEVYNPSNACLILSPTVSAHRTVPANIRLMI
jgi:hypothetical protein